ncbi:hypothetical protein Clacol_000758 [Clathrus columnatus]|uniref:EthD domain-containing protein n=1 Tax=Clathrus columnatus TaxID=1419009 RepID=A0AAV5A3U0_9AGAM|nr:hypothetical protein Clacol_000758 [Clathrus columnatus]
MTVRIILLLKRRADLSQEEFAEYWSKVHVPIVSGTEVVKQHFLKYSQFHVVPAYNETLKKDGVPLAPYDGVVEFEVENVNDFLTVVKSTEYLQKIIPDGLNFLDLNSMIFLAGEGQVILFSQKT